MFLITIFVFIVSFFKLHQLITFLASKTNHWHSLCVSISPPSHYREFYSALVCGANLPSSSLKESFKVSGLLHLMVVSGSHLIFLLMFYEKLFQNRFRPLKVPLLICYTFITGFQPPTLRALVGISIRKLNEARFYFWDSVQICWISGVLTILLLKDWSNSFSLLLSWAATLALSLTQNLKGLKRQSLIFLMLFPVLIPLCPPHPISILMNVIVAPFLELVLFPLSILSYVLPIYKMVDYLWQALEFILSKVSESFTSPPPYQIPISYLWIYLFFLNLYFYFVRIYKNAK